MSESTFRKIIHEIQPYLSNQSQIDLFLENEPLLDKYLFERAQYVKRQIPDAITSIVTNGSLIYKYKEELIKYFDKIRVSLYGANNDVMSQITQKSISRSEYNDIINNSEYVANRVYDGKIAILGKNKNKEKITSRAGFLSNNKILKTSSNIQCAKEEPSKFFNFLADGSMILCCMDWIKETVMGNIETQALHEILDSERAQSIILKARGRIESEKDFICKRCERNLGE